ncbi:putative dihydrokaempferol 4-reductase (NAD-dependent epimerase/dehydratase) [Scheffersomyces xylosifermentans]|uniref:putative dihydrokaempferol 4-reductase (NAD-dependent epimerase/dehydratase) n=1 Tax=Scheffersomyces xylosifermentans TaxID=1304137 RepID=UPI00315D3F9A
MTKEIVLVTGGTGHVGSHILLQLLEAGQYQVRTTVRSLSKKQKLFTILKDNSSQITDELIQERLSVYEADLTSDKGWKDAIRGCDFVLHVASPLIVGQPKNPDDVIIPAKEGALRVVKFAHQLNVKKLILTSSFLSVGFGHPDSEKFVDERDWSPIERIKDTYVKSKVLAERAVWEYVEGPTNQKSTQPLVVTALLPGAILGPALKGMPYTATLDFVKMILHGELKTGAPRIYLRVVDVRDVAQLHIEALKNPASDGERYILTSNEDENTILDICSTLKAANLKGVDSSVFPKRFVPSWLLCFLSTFVTELKGVVPHLDQHRITSSAKAIRDFKWTPIPTETTYIDTARSMVDIEKGTK